MLVYDDSRVHYIQINYLFKKRYRLSIKPINILKYRLLLLCLFLSLFWSCDEVPLSEGSETALIQSFSIDPDEITFFDTAEVGDTTVTIDINMVLKEPSTASYNVAVSSGSDDPIIERMRQTDLLNYSQSVDLELNTAISKNISVHVFSERNPNSESAEATLRVRTEIAVPPVMLDAFNTEVAQIPESGNERINFYAKVTHPIDQSLIDRVNFFMIDQNGQPLGGLFEMFDDGVFNEEQGFIDEVAGDSLYSRAFFIGPQNNPDVIDVFYFATGPGGISSDTLQTTLEIVE